MNLTNAYQRQFALRSWSRVFELLPNLDGQLVLDLGCGIGDQTAELVARGASSIGIDVSDEMLASAKSRAIPNTDFRRLDLGEALGIENLVDGIWCSFAAAYFPELVPRLMAWKEHLKPGGWIALTEIDNLFGHEPLNHETRTLLDSYERTCQPPLRLGALQKFCGSSFPPASGRLSCRSGELPSSLQRHGALLYRKRLMQISADGRRWRWPARDQDRVIRDDPDLASNLFQRLRPHLSERMG